MEPMLLSKHIMDDDYVYVEHDHETDHHLINRIRWKIVYESEERDYIPDDRELINWITIAMDDWAEIYIVPASLVEWSPYDEWYFIY